jgi:hypothetical protein
MAYVPRLYVCHDTLHVCPSHHMVMCYQHRRFVCAIAHSLEPLAMLGASPSPCSHASPQTLQRSVCSAALPLPKPLTTSVVNWSLMYSVSFSLAIRPILLAIGSATPRHAASLPMCTLSSEKMSWGSAGPQPHPPLFLRDHKRTPPYLHTCPSPVRRWPSLVPLAIAVPRLT